MILLSPKLKELITDDRENEVSAVGVNDGHFLNDIDKTQPAEEASQADKASLHQEGKDQGGVVAMQPLRSELHLQSRDDQAGTQSVKRKLRYPLAVLCIQKAGADCCKADCRDKHHGEQLIHQEQTCIH